MAKGRFISKEICLDKRVNELSDSNSILGFTWLITHLDCEGRTYGDPAIVKSLIFPRRPEITIEMVEYYIKEWAEAGLIILYEADDIYIQFPNFDKHQVGLRKDREPASIISELTEDCRIIAGKYPAEVNVKLIKVNNNVKLNGENQQQPANIFTKLENTLQIMCFQKDIEDIEDLVKEHGEERLLKAAQWLKEKDPEIRNMSTALKAIDKAARNWMDNPTPKKPQNNNRKKIFEMLEQEA